LVDVLPEIGEQGTAEGSGVNCLWQGEQLIFSFVDPKSTACRETQVIYWAIEWGGIAVPSSSKSSSSWAFVISPVRPQFPLGCLHGTNPARLNAIVLSLIDVATWTAFVIWTTSFDLSETISKLFAFW
jgi:hypothetical protein